MSVLVVLCALLIVAGGLSLLAAVMGNPVRIGPLSVPGPERALERAVIGVVGAVCMAAVLPIVMMNNNPAATPFRTANAIGAPDSSSSSVHTSRPPTPSATPEPGPSVAAASPGVPTVTSIAVGQDSGAGCVRTFTATVHISDGPVAVRYRVYVNGAVSGDPNRQKTISGTGARTLDSIQVTASRAGEVRVRFDVLGPNPTILTGSATWTAPAACNPAGPPPTTAPPTPTLSVSGLNVTGPAPTDSCTNATVTVSATLTVGSAPAGLDVSYTILFGSQPASDTVHVNVSAPVSKQLVMPTATPGTVTVQITVTAPGAQLASDSTDYVLTCTAA
jgi:hypothetical protein